jgi:dTMP kinase
VPVEVGLARKGSDEQQRFEAGFDVAYHQRVREGFWTMAADEPERFVMVDATAGVSAVAAQIRRAVGRLPGLASIALVPASDSTGEPEASQLRMTR